MNCFVFVFVFLAVIVLFFPSGCGHAEIFYGLLAFLRFCCLRWIAVPVSEKSGALVYFARQAFCLQRLFFFFFGATKRKMHSHERHIKLNTELIDLNAMFVNPRYTCNFTGVQRQLSLTTYERYYWGVRHHLSVTSRTDGINGVYQLSLTTYGRFYSDV